MKTAQQCTVLIMAAGTGGHVFPALSTARRLQKKGVNVQWLGTPSGMENDLLRSTDIDLHRVPVSGLRGSGLRRRIQAPFMIARAFAASWRVLGLVRPHCVLGMGGFVCGPAGIAAWLRRIPLLIHEQNAVAGLTNKLLARISTRVLEAFPDTFAASARLRHVGNPVRAEIAELYSQARMDRDRRRPLRLLVLGGSQGAQTINKLLPEVVVNWPGSRPKVLHQTGANNQTEIASLYESLGMSLGADCRVTAFISDIAEAYRWADLVIARSGASTVTEIAVAGLPAVFIPYPFHKDKQQLLNARWLTDKNAAFLLEQKDLSAKALLSILGEIDLNRTLLVSMSRAARAQAVTDAGELVAEECRKFCNV